MNASVSNLVSICIPACNRPALLLECLRSCEAQTVQEFEIVICDDSSDDRCQHLIDSLPSQLRSKISYTRNSPPLGQNSNVNELFKRAKGDRLILIHDDDRLLPASIALLSRPFAEISGLTISYGKQVIIDADGLPNPRETAIINAWAKRSGVSGPIEDPLSAALYQSIPNNGYMIRTSIAREVGYRSHENVGIYGDAEFAIRLGKNIGRGMAFFVDEFCSEYRLHAASTTSNDRNTEHLRSSKLLYDFVASIEATAAQDAAKKAALSQRIQQVVKYHALRRERKRAFAHFMSSTYGWRYRCSARGLYHLALIVRPQLDDMRRFDSR